MTYTTNQSCIKGHRYAVLHECEWNGANQCHYYTDLPGDHHEHGNRYGMCVICRYSKWFKPGRLLTDGEREDRRKATQ